MNVNPMDFLQVMGGRNPQQEAMNMLKRMSGNNPMANNLLNMINSNNYNGASELVNNMARERGIDINQIRNMMQHR